MGYKIYKCVYFRYTIFNVMHYMTRKIIHVMRMAAKKKAKKPAKRKAAKRPARKSAKRKATKKR